MSDLEALSDESVMRSYEAIREQVAADARSSPYHFMGAGAKERADTLLAEMRRRGLVVSPIDWPD